MLAHEKDDQAYAKTLTGGLSARGVSEEGGANVRSEVGSEGGSERRAKPLGSIRQGSSELRGGQLSEERGGTVLRVGGFSAHTQTPRSKEIERRRKLSVFVRGSSTVWRDQFVAS